MRHKHLLIGLLFAVILSWPINSAFGLAYFGYNETGNTWHDADKTDANPEDDNLCWAATASNILAGIGWGNPTATNFNNADDIFGYFQDHWTDEGGNMYYGLDWWFDGTNDKQGESSWSQVDVEGGGFWPTYSFKDYYFFSSSDNAAMGDIDALLHNGYGVGLSLHGPSGHAVTAWGYEHDDHGNYLGIYITDSDDSEEKLQYYDVIFSGSAWFLQDYSGHDSYFISEVQGFTQFPVPEPATLLLLGTGLVGLTGIRRKMSRILAVRARL